jgi:hypothetical protein
MFTYAQLQAGVEADQLYFDVELQIFDCHDEHYNTHSAFDTCQPSCPFFDPNKERCNLPSSVLVKSYFLDAIRKHNPEYLL